MDTIEYKRLANSEDTHWWFRAKRLFIRTVLPTARGNLEILDIGAGTGSTSLFLEHWGKVTRVESSPVAIDYLKKKNISVITSDIMTFQFPQEAFTLVTCIDVLYHQNITDDRLLLKRIFGTLKPNGLLLITDCALPFLYSSHDTRNKARERYTKAELEMKVRQAGFTVIRSSYIFFLLFPFFLISRIAEKFNDHSDVDTPSPWINRLLFNLCQLEAKLLKTFSFPIGSSVIMLARKS